MRRKPFGQRRNRRPDRARKLLEEYRRGFLRTDTEKPGPDDAAFMEDAQEGIRDFGDQGKLDDYVYQLNHRLARHTGNIARPHRPERKNNLNLTLIILLLLLLLLLAYWVVTKQLQG